MSAFTKLHASVKIEDSGAGVSLTFDDVGDLSFAGLEEALKEVVPLLERGEIACVEFGDEKQIGGSLSAYMKRESLHHATSARIYNAVMKTGAFGSATTTNPGGVGPMLWTLTWTLNDGAGNTASLAFPRVRIAADIDESGEAVKWTINWNNYGGTLVAT